MTGISRDEWYLRVRTIIRTMSTLRDHRISQHQLAEIASRHVYTPVTAGWVQCHWDTITRETHDDHPDLFVFRPMSQWGWYVGATTNISYAKITLFERHRQARNRMLWDLRNSGMRDLARLDPDVAALTQRYDEFINGPDPVDEQYRQLLDSLAELPVVTALDTIGL